MTLNEAKKFIEAATKQPVVECSEGFHVNFRAMDMLTEAQWNKVKAAQHDTTDKGVWFY